MIIFFLKLTDPHKNETDNNNNKECRLFLKDDNSLIQSWDSQITLGYRNWFA